jgi:hypothetical protein
MTMIVGISQPKIPVELANGTRKKKTQAIGDPIRI